MRSTRARGAPALLPFVFCACSGTPPPAVEPVPPAVAPVPPAVASVPPAVEAVPPAAAGTAESRIVMLRHAVARELAVTIGHQLARERQRTGRPTAVEVGVHAATNALVLVGPAADLAPVVELIVRLDVER